MKGFVRHVAPALVGVVIAAVTPPVAAQERALRVSSTLLTLLVLPVVYAWLGGRRLTTELTRSEEHSL